MTAPYLSIVVPMREGVPKEWFDAFLSVEGDVEFILVYPPAANPMTTPIPGCGSLSAPFEGRLFSASVASSMPRAPMCSRSTAMSI